MQCASGFVCIIPSCPLTVRKSFYYSLVPEVLRASTDSSVWDAQPLNRRAGATRPPPGTALVLGEHAPGAGAQDEQRKDNANKGFYLERPAEMSRSPQPRTQVQKG